MAKLGKKEAASLADYISKNCSANNFSEANFWGSDNTTVYYLMTFKMKGEDVVFALALECELDSEDYRLSFYPRMNRKLVGEEGLKKIENIITGLEQGFVLYRRPHNKLKYWKVVGTNDKEEVSMVVNNALTMIGQKYQNIYDALNDSLS